VLASCYPSSLTTAAIHQLRSVAFPAISTGAYGYPVALAVVTARECAASFRDPAEAIFCCLSRADLRIYESLLQRED